ncbi:zinc-finger homeodomain protein 9-like [Gastrolobium bilobum]|uniref:zinc-finger homeodomain protein 9-like n=1 Tax=Gastrolobium bilobum TaxID=150636 RepID=UPI002AB05956|nr:zinc-finger homeodomain protein 9-like [Gastrolobium bilobum]XP_061356089.1 zinc-finger homeodomain protein 9-like [Gastrolobium bilobum]
MDIITTTNTNTNTNTPTSITTGAKSPEPEPETPTRIQQQPLPPPNTIKPLSFSNGVLKRHHPHHPHHHHPTVAATYKECLKNHAANLGGHALDGCGEFMPSPTATAGDPTSIKCAACGCHRNFHRREPDELISATTHVIEYQPHHRHHPPPPPPPLNRSPNSASPPPISSSYYPSAPHMLLALSGAGGLSVAPENTAAPTSLASPSPTARKRFRTKFTPEQKEKMHEFADRVGWKMQKRDEDMVMEFCNEVGVDRSVLKVWMHNNKNTYGKRDNVNVNVNVNANGGVVGGNILEQDHNINAINTGINGNGNSNGDDNNNNNLVSQDPSQYENDSGTNVGTNGSSSSS